MQLLPATMPRVNIPRETLQALIEAYAGAPDVPIEVLRHGVLPLIGDFVGWWVLTVDGSVAFVSHEAPQQLEIVSDHPVEAAGVHVALAVGSRRHRALKAICPARSQRDIACKACDGSGRRPDWTATVICAGAGLGWHPPEWFDGG